LAPDGLLYNRRAMIKRPWSILSVLFLINLLNFLDRQLPGALAEPIRREFALSDTALGLLSTVFTLMYAAAGLPLGFVADRWHRPRLIAAGASIWSFFTLAGALASSYGVLFAARIGVGIGEASCSPAAQSLIGDLFPQRQRARAMAAFMVGLPLGIFLSYVLGGQIGSRYGWRAPLIVAGVPGLLLAGLILFAQEPVRGAADPHLIGGEGSQRSQFGTLLRTPTLWWIIASGALHNFNMYAVSAFLTPFLQRFHGLGLKEANNVSAVALGAVGVVGMLAGGWIADRLGTRRAEGRILLAAAAMVGGAPLMYLALKVPSGEVLPFMVLMGASLMLLYVYYATVYAAIQDIVDPRSRGLAVALYFFAMYVLGASAGPVTTGWLSDHFAREAMFSARSAEMLETFKAAGLHAAMFIIPLIAGVCALVLYAGSRTVARDIERLRSRSAANTGAAALQSPATG
jgi:predicted MFS family arabinose efflux permease